jgi:hypothetical protein
VAEPLLLPLKTVVREEVATPVELTTPAKRFSL